MTAVIHKISVEAEGKHTLSPERNLHQSVSFGKLRSEQIACEYVCHYTAAKTIKNAYNNASFSSVTAATESLGLSNNDFKTA